MSANGVYVFSVLVCHIKKRLMIAICPCWMCRWQCKKQEMYSQEKQRRAEERKATRFDWQEAITTWYGS